MLFSREDEEISVPCQQSTCTWQSQNLNEEGTNLSLPSRPTFPLDHGIHMPRTIHHHQHANVSGKSDRIELIAFGRKGKFEDKTLLDRIASNDSQPASGRSPQPANLKKRSASQTPYTKLCA